MSTSAMFTLLLGLLIQNALFIGGTFWWLRRSGRTLKSIGLTCPTQRQIGIGVGLGLMVAMGGHFVGEGEAWLCRHLLSPATFGHLEYLTAKYGAEHTFQQLPLVGMLLFAGIGTLAAPLGEELLFRGLIYNALQKQGGTSVAIWGSALLFALLHVSPLNLLPIFLMGLAFAFVYARTGSLWMTICMHAVNNTASFIMLAWTLYF